MVCESAAWGAAAHALAPINTANNNAGKKASDCTATLRLIFFIGCILSPAIN
jgi:hypothetical protein